MRVLFIYPNLNAQIGFNYGVAFLSAVLKAHGHETALLNINDTLDYPLNWDRIKADITSFAPQLVGISMVSNQYQYCEQVAAFVKKKNFRGCPLLVAVFMLQPIPKALWHPDTLITSAWGRVKPR